MKKLQQLVTLILICALSLSTTTFPVKAADDAETPESFYRDLANMIAAQDDTNYFGSMELAIGSNEMVLDGVGQTMDAAPVMKDQRTMLPIRPIAETIGAEVDYDTDTHSVVITGPYGDEINCPTGGSTMTVNDEPISLDVPSYIQGGRTYMPVRAISEALDLAVEWSSEIQGAVITAPYQTARVLAWASHLDTAGLGASAVLNDNDGLWILQFDTPGAAKTATEQLTAQGILAEPDTYLPPVDDKDGSSNDVSAQTYSWGVSACNFDDYVKKYSGSFSGSGVVAVVDTGVCASHPFLNGKVLSGYDFVDGDSNADDGHFHGTHVAGTIIDCCCGAPVKILPVRVLNSQGSGYSSTVASGIKYAANKGADVINLSLGGGHSNSKDQAIQYAIGKGATVVVAAGNDNRNTTNYCPAHITNSGVVVVSAGDSGKKKASFSNYGKSVDLMAPGVDIKASVPKSSYRSLNGTSMATPHAAAAVMLLDLANGKRLSPAQLEQKVRSATTYGTWKDQYAGCGFLDMMAGSGSTPVTPTPTPTVKSYRFSVRNISLQVGSTADLKVYAVYSDGSTKDVTSSCSLTSSNSGIATVSSSGTVTGKSAGTVSISMRSPTSGVSAAPDVTVKVTGTPVTTPKVTAYQFSVSSLTLKKGETANVRVIAVYSNGSTKDVTSSSGLYSTDTSVATVSSTGTVTAKGKGSARIAMSATPDGGGIKVPNPISVTVTEQESTIKSYEYSVSSLTLDEGETATIRVYAIYTDGSRKDVTSSSGLYSTDTSVATVSSSGTVTARNAGTAYIAMGDTPSSISIPSPVKVTVNAADDGNFIRLEWWSEETLAHQISLRKGYSTQITLYGITESGKKVDLTRDCEIYSLDPDIASISSSGTLKAVETGTTYINVGSVPNTGLTMKMLEIEVFDD